jgi:hypothetical protein
LEIREAVQGCAQIGDQAQVLQLLLLSESTTPVTLKQLPIENHLWHNMKNMMIQEFQHCMEFQLIEGMKMKMQMIQFVSIVNLIQ